MQTTKNVIANDVAATQLIIRPTVITFISNRKRFFLRSVRITNKVSESILCQIQHRFTLVRDITSLKPNSKKGKKEFRFQFYPANDLSFLLAEIQRLSNKDEIEVNEEYPLSGEFELPWSYVKFYDGIMMIFHPNPSNKGKANPFYIRNSEILKSFEYIRPYIETHCCKLYVRAVDGEITHLFNIQDFLEKIVQYKNPEYEEEVEFKQSNNITGNSKITKDLFSKTQLANKSPYLSYLSYIQNPRYEIIYLLERVIYESNLNKSEEYGYLFVLQESSHEIILLYENITNLSRSSVVFFVNPTYYSKSIDIIRKFFASTITNKRKKLSSGKIRFNPTYILNVKRINHTNLIDWKYSLLNILTK